MKTKADKVDTRDARRTNLHIPAHQPVAQRRSVEPGGAVGAAFRDNRSVAVAQRKLQESIDNSPRQLEQAARLKSLFGPHVQRMVSKDKLQTMTDPAIGQLEAKEEGEELQPSSSLNDESSPEAEAERTGRLALAGTGQQKSNGGLHGRADTSPVIQRVTVGSYSRPADRKKYHSIKGIITKEARLLISTDQFLRGMSKEAMDVLMGMDNDSIARLPWLQSAYEVAKDPPKYIRKVDQNQYKNAEAYFHPDKFLYKHANNNWFHLTGELYRQGQVHHPRSPEDAAKTPPYGMQTLLDYRQKITLKLLNDVKAPAKRYEIKKRKKLRFPNPNDVKEVRGNAPGSENPTSDIDVNLSGDGTEFAVRWLNRKFKEDYGHGQESGIVYDVNFYAKDFVPGKMFGLKATGALDRPEEGDQKFYAQDRDWRDHVVRKQIDKKREADNQIQASLVMMIVNMGATSDFVKNYIERLCAANFEGARELKTLFRQAKGAEIMRARAIEDKQLVNYQRNKGSQEQQTTSETMAKENRIYEEKLRIVEQRRLAFDLLAAQAKVEDEGQGGVSPQTRDALDRAYVNLNAAKLKAVQFANEAYYSQGAVIGVVANKQILGRMYKPKKEYAANDPRAKKAQLKLPLEAHEYYSSFNEQIGFAYHALPAANATDNTFLNKGAKAGKYVHRAYNAVKHLRNVYDPLGQSGVVFLHFDRERRAAAAWEGVKQEKRKGNAQPEHGFVEDVLDKRQAFRQVLLDLGIQPARYSQNARAKLTDLKLLVDRLYFAVRNNQRQI